MKMSLLLLTAVVCSCTSQNPSSDRPTPEASEFFADYVKNDGPSPDTLPVFLSACRGDLTSLDAIFSDYKRFGSGDSEAWGDVPDVFLAELGDQRFSSYASRQSLARRITVLKWLGVPGTSLFEDTELRKCYPKTASLQEDVFIYNPVSN